jgi:DNA-binding transcriptional ArsR family regulator
MGGELYSSSGILIAMASMFEVLAEPRRREILDLLRERERSVNELVERVAISQPGVSKHLRVLREAGLVDVRPEAQRRIYLVRPAPLMELDAWIAPYRRLWADKLDALERHLDASEQGERR